MCRRYVFLEIEPVIKSASTCVTQFCKPSTGTSSTLNPSYVAKALAGTSVFTDSNEFVLIWDPTSDKSISLLCVQPRRC
ncbi:hypothetical protein Bca4012_058082 [Brassica carinata]